MSELTWQIIRKNSCFLRYQRGIQKPFSVEKFNLLGKNSPRYNGLINKKGIDVSAAEDGKGVVVSTKIAGKTNRPAKSVRAQVYKNPMKTTKSIAAVANNQGLGGQAKLAQRIASAIIRSQRPKSKKHVKKTEA